MEANDLNGSIFTSLDLRGVPVSLFVVWTAGVLQRLDDEPMPLWAVEGGHVLCAHPV